MSDPILEELDEFIEEMNIIGKHVTQSDYDRSHDSDYLKRVVGALEGLGRVLRSHLEGSYRSSDPH